MKKKVLSLCLTLACLTFAGLRYGNMKAVADSGQENSGTVTITFEESGTSSQEGSSSGDVSISSKPDVDVLDRDKSELGSLPTTGGSFRIQAMLPVLLCGIFFLLLLAERRMIKLDKIRDTVYR